MQVLWHSVKYPPKKDGMYYISSFYSHFKEEGGALARYRSIMTVEYTTELGWNTSRNIGRPSTFLIREDDEWAEVQYVED